MINKQQILNGLKCITANPKNKKTIIIIAVSTVLALILGVFIYGYSILLNIDYNELPGSDEELGITTVPEHEDKGDSGAKSVITNVTDIPDVDIPDITNIVLFGIDRRNPDEASRSDTIIVVSLDRKNEKIKVISLMRDMYVPIYGRESIRINAAYAYGGAELSIKTINSNFGLDIRNYAAVDFGGFEKIIDKLGGVEIDVKDYEVLEIEGVSEPGLQYLNGKQAVDYSRIRYVGNADFERTARQRNILNVLYRKINNQEIVKLQETIVSLMPYVETSLTKIEIITLALDVLKYDTDSIEQLRLPADGLYKNQKIRGMYVLVPDLEKNKNLLHDFIYGTEY